MVIGRVRELPRAYLARTPWPGRRRRSGVLLLSSLGVLLAAIYVLTAPGNRSETDDGFAYAYEVGHGRLPELFRDPTHLLFLPLARGGLDLLRGVGVDPGAYDAIRLANSLLAAAAVVLFGVMLRRRLGLSAFAASAGAAGLAISYGFWRYANEADLYPAAVLGFVVLCLVAFSGL